MYFRKFMSIVLAVLCVNLTCFAYAKVPAKTVGGRTPARSGSNQTKKLHVPSVEEYLLDGTLGAGETALQGQLINEPSDKLRFQLGFLQFLRAGERFAQDLYRFGLRDLGRHGLASSLMQSPLVANPNPETLSYEKARLMAETFRAKLVQAEETLAPISDANVQLPIHFGMIRLDMNGDGRSDKDETLWNLYAKLTRNEHISAEQSQHFCINFDRGDVHWLRGYCHLLAAVTEVYLAHDTREMFDCTAHILFTKVDSPYKFLDKGKRVHNLSREDVDVLDLIAMIHTIRWPVVEPQRLQAALHHLEAVPEQSRESWKFILAETDNDREWLPNPQQTGVIPGVKVTNEMVYAWGEMMDQADKVLAGKLLIPFWRGEENRGVNLRRVFLEPRTLDLVLWVQGPYATPYLEQGATVKNWRPLMNEFGGRFPGFALWFN